MYHANAIVDMRGDDKDGVSREKVELNDAEAHCEDSDHNGTQRDQQPVERRTSRVAHSAYHTPTL